MVVSTLMITELLDLNETIKLLKEIMVKHQG